MASRILNFEGPAARGEQGERERTIPFLKRALRQGQHGTLGLALFALFLALALLRVEPIHTYSYVCAWYPALLWLDARVQKRRGASLLVDRPLALLSLAAWSVPFWLVYEAINLRLENWYYIETPAEPLRGHLFLLAAFATVLPGIVMVMLWLDSFDLFARVRTRPFHASRRLRRALVALGVAFLVLPLALPRFFFPLVWGFAVLLLEPFNRRAGWPSLLRDLEHGRPRRLLLLLAAGAITGLFWEVMNLAARARWIYTVPLFEDGLGVEMPPLGFVGFLPFALSAYSAVRALEILGLSVPFESAASHSPTRSVLPPMVRVLVLPLLVAGFSMATILALDERTVDSRQATVRDLASASRRERATLSLLGVERLDELVTRASGEGGISRLALELITEPARVETMVDESRLALLRGIGARNAHLLLRIGVDTIEELARSDPAEIYAALAALGPAAERVRPQRVKVWIRAARAAHASAP